MDVVEIRGRIKQIINDVTDIDVTEISDEASFQDDLGLDSLSLLEIGVNLDYEFKLGLPDEALREIDTVDAAVTLVLCHLEETALRVEVA